MELLTPEVVRPGLRATFLGRTYVHYPSTSSTMDRAKEYAREGCPEGTVIIAEEQTAGRGRQQRPWLSPKGKNLTFSVVLYPQPRPAQWLTPAAGIAVARAVEGMSGLTPRLKWPNDVLLGGKKVGGILVESETQGERLLFAVIGIGINVNFDPGQYEEIAATATSLSQELGRAVSRCALLQRTLEELERAYVSLRQGAGLSPEWRRLLDTLGRWVTVSGPGLAVAGYAEDIDEEGRLLVRQANGAVIPLSAGDVTLR